MKRDMYILFYLNFDTAYIIIKSKKRVQYDVVNGIERTSMITWLYLFVNNWE